MRNTRFAASFLWMAACGSVGDNPVCGDGVLERPEEQCDDGNALSGDHCSSTCETELYCGDAMVNVIGEQCDDGNANEVDGCTAACQVGAVCGDGVTEAPETCDDDNTLPADGCSQTCIVETTHRTTVSWTFKSVSGANAPCPQNFDTIAVYSQLVDTTNTPIGSPTIDLFTCSQGSGVTDPLFEGRYQTYLASTNANNTSTYATSLSALVDLRTADGSFAALISTDGGYFELDWAIETANGTPQTCAQATAVDTISLLATITSGTMAYDDLFDCEDGHGVTAALPAGSYTISPAALDSQMAAVGSAPTLTNKVIQAPNKVTDLGAITIRLD